MRTTSKTILYDPINHYHYGFHHQMIGYPPAQITFKTGTIEYVLQEAMVADAYSMLGENFLSIGRFLSDKQSDLLYSPHTLITNEKPWIMDLEHVDWLFINDYVSTNKNKLIPYWKQKLAINYLRSKFCKRILCRSKTAVKSLVDIFDDEVINKKSVLFYPVQEYRPKAVRKNNRKVRLLFICSEYAHWYRKGGDIAIMIFLKLKKNFPKLELHYVGELPERLLQFPLLVLNRDNFKKIPGLFHYKNMQHNRLLTKIYPRIDILLFPSRADTFGTVVLEAMSFGIPVIASCGNHVFGIQDVIDDGKNGFLVYHNDERTSYSLAAHINTTEFIKKTKRVIESVDLRQKMGENARTLFKKGSFSIAHMQKTLSRIIEEL